MIEYIFEIWWILKDGSSGSYHSYYECDIVAAPNGIEGLAKAREVIRELNRKSLHYSHQVRNFRLLDN